METLDVAVVGGGPIGGYVAGKIASQGFKTAIFEEHNKIGEPIRCAGLISPKIFDIEIKNKSEIVQNKIYGANIYPPNKNKLAIGGEKLQALVVNRQLLDEGIVQDAEKKGAKIHLESKITMASTQGNKVHLNFIKKQKRGKTNSSLLIGADGSASPVRDIFDFPKPNELLHSIGAEVSNVELDPRFVDIFLGRKIAPGFFAWIIPLNEYGNEARIGLCVDKDSRNLLRECFDNLLKTQQLRKAEIIRYIGGTIPLGPLKKTVKSNVMLVGDAAAQVKPTSGGGVYPGLVCAGYCSSVAIESLQREDYSSRFLNKYHKLWSKEIGKELNIGMRFRNFFKNLEDKKINNILNSINNEKSIKVIEEFGDIDYPSKLAFPLLKANPMLLKFLPSVFKI